MLKSDRTYREAYGRERTEPMWRAFLDRLSLDDACVSQEDIVASACRTATALRA